MPGVREKLNVFLDRAARKPFAWGQADCMLEVADWLDYACGSILQFTLPLPELGLSKTDPEAFRVQMEARQQQVMADQGAAAAWRGTYSTEAELTALLEPLGGLEAAMRAEGTRLGLQEAAQPLFGDVGLMTLAGQEKPLGAILMPSGRWRMKTATGIALTAAVTVIVAWSLPCRPVVVSRDE